MPDDVRERILAYGSAGVGKSFAILNLAQIVSVTSPESTVWIIDADDGLAKLRKAKFPFLTNIKWEHILAWPQIQEAIPFLKANVKRHDWICIDMIGRFWEMAQSFEVGEVYGKTASEFMLVARAEAIAAAKLNKPATLPSVDWNIVKKLHNDDFIDKLASDFPCNLFVTTSADPLIADMDDPKTIAMFASVGFKPDGEKRNPHRFDTVMFLRSMRDGTRVFSTIKDRARPLIKETPFESLIGDYNAALLNAKADPIFK